jgi:hypothetical protein
VALLALGLLGCPMPIELDLDPGCNPLAMTDECYLPFPSAFFQAPDPSTSTGFRLDYPADTLETEPGELVLQMGPLNVADGSSPAGPLLLHLGRDVHPDHLVSSSELERSLAPDAAIALFNLETGQRILLLSEMDQNRDPAYPNRSLLILRPMEAMAMGQRHGVVLTAELSDAAGRAFESPASFAALREGRATDDERVEGVRERYEGIFELLDERGYPRSDLLLVWDFVVASADYLTGSVRSMRELALEEVAAGALDYSLSRVVDDPTPDLARLLEGSFEVPTFLDEDNEFDYDDAHHPRRRADNRSFPFTMIVPNRARTGAVPLVVFGHGLFGSGRSYLSGWGLELFGGLAEERGAVLVATDWIGLSSGDLELIIAEVVPDLNRIGLVTDRLQQSLINNLTLTELAVGPMSADPAFQVRDGELIDPGQVHYYGVSLGGIQGSSFVSISNRIRRGVLAVPGSVWFNMLPRSVHWNLLAPFVNAAYPDPLTRQLGLAFVQARFDHSDPINLTRHLSADPLPGAPADKILLLQEAIGDSQVPNMTTEMLARAVGAKLVEPSVTPVPGLDGVLSSTFDSALVQVHLVEQAESNPPPEGNIPPATDNDVHSDILSVPQVMEQTIHFLRTGEIRQSCEGPCDPD